MKITYSVNLSILVFLLLHNVVPNAKTLPGR